MFGGEHANVQPASGSLANLAAYRALLRPGDTLLSMAVTSGGHLSHGHPKHIVSELYRVVPYSVDPETGLLPYDDIREIAERERPRVIVAGYSAYPRAVDFALFGEVARDVGRPSSRTSRTSPAWSPPGCTPTRAPSRRPW